MKILIITHLYFPSVGGNQMLNKELAEQLARQGHHVTALTANAVSFEEFHRPQLMKSLLPDQETINGVTVKRLKIHHNLDYFLFKLLDKIRGGFRLRQIITKDSFEILGHGPFIPQMLNEIKNENPDIMIAINYYPATLYFAYQAKIRYKIPLMVLPLTHISDPWAFHPILKKIYSAADKVVTSTEFEKNYLTKFGIL